MDCCISSDSDYFLLDMGIEMIEKTVCPSCGSERIGYFRLDSDWGHGGDWSSVNPAESYTKEDIHDFDGNERPDVSAYVCIVCSKAF